MQNGYYFVILEYLTGRYAVSTKKYDNPESAQKYADKRGKEPRIKRAFTAYQVGLGEINLNHYV